MSDEIDFVKVSIKKDVADKITQICEDAKREGIFISKSELIREMINDGNVIEYTIKKIVYNKRIKNPGTMNFPEKQVFK